MISTFLTVLRKEVVDNLRDRRTLFTVLVFGPLFGPLFYTLMMSTIINKQIADLDQPLKLPVAGAQYAPQLMDFLKQHDTIIEAPPADPRQAVARGLNDVVLVIPASYASAFSTGNPATLQLVMDNSRESAGKNVERAHRLLDAYGQSVSVLRLLARGVDPLAVAPLAVEEADVSTPKSRAVLLLAMLPYFFLFAAILGAFYLAIDTTAGERERGSLEPLLTTAVPRAVLVTGKLGAVTLFSAISLGLDVIAMVLCQGFIPAAKLNIAVDITPLTGLAAFLVSAPFCLFIAALLSVVASFTKSYKEAQTWLSFIMILPIIPVLVMVLNPAEPTLWMMLVPSLSQDVLLTTLIKGEPLKGLFVAVSAASSLLLGALLAALAVWLYRRERILG